MHPSTRPRLKPRSASDGAARQPRMTQTRPKLYQLTQINITIGLGHNLAGISTDSARVPETMGNNRHDSDNRDMRRGPPHFEAGRTVSGELPR
jgi:hypothetical protein